jgi:HPr kinase/phosphorylase
LTETALLHASSVAVDGRGVLILGASGSGKSSLALQLIAQGAQLVCDDQTELHRDGAALIARAPARLANMIEARGLGLLHSPALAQAAIELIVDLDQIETQRLPPQRSTIILGATRPLVLASQSNHFSAAILCYLKGGRLA